MRNWRERNDWSLWRQANTLKDENFQTYLEMLERYKFIVPMGNDHNMHPSFIAVFKSHLVTHQSVLEAIHFSVDAYEPTASILERATISQFVQMWLRHASPSLYEILIMEMNVSKLMNPSLTKQEYPYETIDEVVEAIKRDKDSV